MRKMAWLIVLLAVIVGTFPVYAGELEFTQTPFPGTDLEKRVPLSSQYASVDGKIVPFGFHTILRSGDEPYAEEWESDKDRWHKDRHHKDRWDQDNVFGQLINIRGNNLIAEDGSYYISNDNDFSSLLKGRDKNLYMVSHFESRPGAMYLTQLKQTEDGHLMAVKTRPLDFSRVKGGWVHCAGSVTPWGTHLGSEEYEPDAKTWITGEISEYNAAMAAYFGVDPTDLPAVQEIMNPYNYGYAVEVIVKDYEHAKVEKHYAMGRVAIELAYVMPDDKTVYISDDGTNVGLFRFEADIPGDLSKGTLYAAVYNETDKTGMGAANLTWVDLGHTTDAEIAALIKSGTKFNDIFDYVDPDNGSCPAGYISINAGHEDGNHQCLKVKTGMEKAASRLETRRYAAMLGATTEWRKMEGITFNPDTRQLYIAISEIGRGMEDFKKSGDPNDTYDKGGPNHIKMDSFNTCGGVYALDVDGNYDATNTYGLVAGIPTHTSYGAKNNDNYDKTNKCDVNGLANPDNITYIPGYNTLIIGEDSGDGHQNDMVWAFDTETNNDAETTKLTRIQTTPYGSETTSPYFYPDINGFAYIMSVIQHPYGESDSDMLVDPSEKRAYTGYLGPLPALHGYDAD